MTRKQLVRLCAATVAITLLAFSVFGTGLVQAAPASIVVDDSSDGDVCPIFLTLRCAINYANNPIHPGTSIRFAPGLAAVMLQSSLPVITADFTWIDGYDNTNGTCCQVIDGSSMSSGDGLTINANYVTISHMTVINVPSAGADIMIAGGKDIEISYGYLGILPGATQCAGRSSLAGVNVFLDLAGSAGSDNGVAYIFADTISCHVLSGVVLQGSRYVYVGMKRDLTPFGNYFGTTSDGTRAAGNGAGVQVLSNSDNITIRDNILSANGRGLVIGSSGTISDLQIEGNKIGTSFDGSLPLPNTQEGMLILGGTSIVLTKNRVAYNGAAGIALTGSDTHAAIRDNDIFRNGGLPIDLGNDGHTPNDPGDTDFGPNGLLNYPEVTTFSGSLVAGTACAGCRIYIFKAVGNPAAPGGGGIYQAFVDANPSGDWAINLPNSLTRLDVTFTAEYGAFVSSEMSPRPVLFLPLISR